MSAVSAEKPKRVLVVDDEPTLLDLFPLAIATPTREIETAENGQIALDKLAEGTFDLILLDLRMPNLSGIDVLRELRRRCDLTRVILCSAFIPERSLIEAMSLGVTIFVSKPVTLTLLRNIVDNALREDWKRDLGPVLDLAEKLDFPEAVKILKEDPPSASEQALRIWQRIYTGITSNCRIDELLPDARKLAKIAVLRD